MKKIVIEFKENEVVTDFDGIKSFTELIVALATLEGVIGGIMEIDKTTIRIAVDEVQKDLSAKLPEDVEP